MIYLMTSGVGPQSPNLPFLHHWSCSYQLPWKVFEITEAGQEDGLEGYAACELRTYDGRLHQHQWKLMHAHWSFRNDICHKVLQRV